MTIFRINKDTKDFRRYWDYTWARSTVLIDTSDGTRAITDLQYYKKQKSGIPCGTRTLLFDLNNQSQNQTALTLN
jgi:hypothetical protein